MKKILLVIGLSCLSMISNAEMTKTEFCKDMSAYAELVMQKRQDNTPIKIMFLAIEKSTQPKSTKRLMELIVEKAYSQPIYFTEKLKITSKNEYSAKVYLDCIKTLSS